MPAASAYSASAAKLSAQRSSASGSPSCAPVLQRIEWQPSTAAMSTHLWWFFAASRRLARSGPAMLPSASHMISRILMPASSARFRSCFR